MIYITGDTHGDITFNKIPIFLKQHPEISKDDYLIITGDFGGVWNKLTLEADLKRYEELPFTVLFVDGNHENFDLLNSYPIEIWHGGKIHKIKDNILHLMRGQVFTIENKTFFTFGGAKSIDKYLRVEHVSWWEEEMPTLEDLEEGFRNLEKYNYKVDYIITHAIDEQVLYDPLFTRRMIYVSKENLLLSQIDSKVEYKHWYFGHYHFDADVTSKKTILYENILKIE